MSILICLNSPAVLVGARGLHLLMPWFGPFGAGLGVLGTRTGLHARHLAVRGSRPKGWWLIPLVCWLPLVYWIVAQFVPQY